MARETLEIVPDPVALVESLRSFPYSAESAIADLIDNSVAANARNVRVHARWNDGNAVVEIIDDGGGMSEPTLESALRFAGMGPSAPRGPKDLGRFGLGLKTASLSQCRRFTVTSMRGGEITNLGWDLEGLRASGGKWIPCTDSSATVETSRRAIGGPQGTMVRWENLDRLLGSDPNLRSVEDFDATLERVANHLSMVFHRLMSRTELDGSPQLRIAVNDRPLAPWDPFLVLYPVAGQVKRVEDQQLDLPSGVSRVVGYVLPSEREARADEALDQWTQTGRGRWNQLQGFYVYRLDRLLTAGGFLGLDRQPEEHTKLARIAIDLNNETDADWQLDVTKSSVTPPPRSRLQLEQIARRVCAQASRRYRSRERRFCSVCNQRPCTCPKPRSVELVWTAPDLLEERGTFKINTSHSVIKTFRNGLEPSQREQFDRILRLIVASLPLGLLRGVPRSEESRYGLGEHVLGSHEEMIRQLITFVVGGRLAKGDDLDAVKVELEFTEPFQDYPELVAAVVQQYRPSGSP